MKIKHVIWTLFALGVNLGFSWAAVKGTNGQILFDVQADGQAEMELNGTGLGIGVSNPSANLQVAGNAVVTESLVVGGSTASSQANLFVHGTIAYGIESHSSGVNILGAQSINIADTSAADVVYKLPVASTMQGRVIKVVRTSTLNQLYISGSGNQIDQDSNLLIGAGNLTRLDLYSDGRQWYVLSGMNATGMETEYLYWALNDTSGNTASDSSVWSHQGNLMGGLNFSGNSVAGNVGTALQMTQMTDSVEYQSDRALVNAGYAYSLWVKSTVASDAGVTYPVNLADNSGFSWDHQDVAYRHSAFHRGSDGNLVLASLPSALAANTWHHIAVSWDGSTLSCYHNGVLASSNTVSTWAGGQKISTGQPGSFSTGTMTFDDVRYFENALSSSRIQSIFAAGSP